jgi:hypothetical protein
MNTVLTEPGHTVYGIQAAVQIRTKAFVNQKWVSRKSEVSQSQLKPRIEAERSESSAAIYCELL